MSEPLVSVVTQAASRSDLVATLSSVAARTMAEWELLLVGGDDDGARELAAARAADDPRVRHIVLPRACSGADPGRNAGIRAARSPFVVLLEPGDVLAPDRLARRVEIMTRNRDFDFAVFPPGTSASAFGDDLCRFLYLESPWTLDATIWRRDALMRLGLFDEKLFGWQALELHVRAITAGCHYARFPEGDRHLDQPLRSRVDLEGPPAPLEGALAAIARLEADIRDGPGMDWVRQRALCSLYFFIAERWVEREELKSALAAWRMVRERQLGPSYLHSAGAALLRLRAAGELSDGLIDAWKAWARLRPVPQSIDTDLPVNPGVTR